MSGYFVTGTDTEIGKTLIASALLHALVAQGVQAAGMKPVAAGVSMINGQMNNEDCVQLAEAANVQVAQALSTPYLLQEPAAPHIAAAMEGVTIAVSHIVDCYQQVAALSQVVVVEGVGGFRVPLNDVHDTADLACMLGLPVIMVVGLRLGCISAALITAEAVKARGLTLVGWVANALTPDMAHEAANIAALRQRLAAPLLGYVPSLSSPSAALAAAQLDFSLLSGWPDKAL
jgi:dethiobiotin synthetase